MLPGIYLYIYIHVVEVYYVPKKCKYVGLRLTAWEGGGDGWCNGSVYMFFHIP